jgi:hypothetical protein
MAWYPGAIKMELQPESDAQPAIRPTQFIVHSIIAPWTAKRTYEYWRDSTSLESHFGIDYDGVVGQYIGTETRADANAGANRRADGTGAVSAETASNTSGTDPWNAKQIEDLIAIGAWLHERHDVPLRICRHHADPGFGYHSMFPQWSTSGTACPGKARIAQFKEVVFPGIVARATGKTTTPEEEEDVALSSDDVRKVWLMDGIVKNPNPATAKNNPHIAPATALNNVEIVARRVDKTTAALTAQVAALAAAVAALARDGGLPLAQVQAAAEAGAQAALDKLGDALTKEN